MFLRGHDIHGCMLVTQRGIAHTAPYFTASCFVFLPEMRFDWDSITLVMGVLCTVNVWNSCGPCPTVSGCCTMTRTVPLFVPYAISIQLPLKPENNHFEIYMGN